MSTPEQKKRPNIATRALNTFAWVEHNIVWPLAGHTIGLRGLNAYYMYANANIQPGQQIAEIGAGDMPYYRIFGFSRLVGPEGKFHVVDNDHTVLARAKGTSHMIDNMTSRRRGEESTEEFHEADARKLPFADNSLDIVIINQLDAPGYAEEVYRVLKPGGRVMESFLEPVIPVFTGMKRSALQDAGFINLNWHPTVPTGLPLVGIFAHSLLPFVPIMNWVVTGTKPDPNAPVELPVHTRQRPRHRRN